MEGDLSKKLYEAILPASPLVSDLNLITFFKIVESPGFAIVLVACRFELKNIGFCILLACSWP